MSYACINHRTARPQRYFSTAAGLIIIFQGSESGRPLYHHTHRIRQVICTTTGHLTLMRNGWVEGDRLAWPMCTRPTAPKLKRVWWSLPSADIRLDWEKKLAASGVSGHPATLQIRTQTPVLVRSTYQSKGVLWSVDLSKGLHWSN